MADTYTDKKNLHQNGPLMEIEYKNVSNTKVLLFKQATKYGRTKIIFIRWRTCKFKK